jgi:hypothetical protein
VGEELRAMLGTRRRLCVVVLVVRQRALLDVW